VCVCIGGDAAAGVLRAVVYIHIYVYSDMCVRVCVCVCVCVCVGGDAAAGGVCAVDQKRFSDFQKRVRTAWAQSVRSHLARTR